MNRRPMSGTPIGYEELVGHLREFAGRVTALQIRDEAGNLTAEGEGEFTISADEPGKFSFQLGGEAPPATEDVEFIVASWTVVHIDAERFVEARRVETGIGPDIDLKILLAGGIWISLWSAMPLRDQWTKDHDEHR
jgi:hypothetical protein